MKRPPLTFRTLIGLLLLGQAAWEKLKPAPTLPPVPPYNPDAGWPPVEPPAPPRLPNLGEGVEDERFL